MLGMFAAFKTLVETGEPWPVFDWSDPEMADDRKPTRFIAIADFTPSRHNPRLSGHRGLQGHMFAITVSGETANEVRDAIDRLRDRLEDRTLTAEGDTTTPLLNEDATSEPIRLVEDSINPRLFTAVDIWKCATVRTSTF